MATRPWPFESSIRVGIEGATAKGVPWANVLWANASISGTADPADLAVVASNIYTSYNTHLFALLGKDATLERVVCNYYGVSPTQLVADHLATESGGSDNNTEVDSLSACVSWTIGQTWRGGKPRTYLPALPTEAFADSNTLDSDFITAALTGALAFRSTFTSNSHGSFSSMGLGCMSFFSGNAPRATGVFFTFQGATMHPRIDSMRRRLGRERL